MVNYLLAHRSRFDVFYIAFRVAKRVLEKQPLRPAGALGREFLDSMKLWDFMEAHADRPREAADEAIAQVLSAIP